MQYLSDNGFRWNNQEEYLKGGHRPCDDLVLFFNYGSYSYGKHVFSNLEGRYRNYTALKYSDFLILDFDDIEISLEDLFS